MTDTFLSSGSLGRPSAKMFRCKHFHWQNTVALWFQSKYLETRAVAESCLQEQREQPFHVITKRTKLGLHLTRQSHKKKTQGIAFPSGSSFPCAYFFKPLRWLKKKKMYSETRLLRTFKGNEKRYVVTKVRSIQNAIFFTGRTGSTCSREQSATEDASPSWMSFIIHFSYGEIAFQGIVNLKMCREIEIETEKLDDMLVIRKKKNQRKSKKYSWRENWYVISDFGATFCTSYPKKMYMFSDWRCPWLTERTL